MTTKAWIGVFVGSVLALVALLVLRSRTSVESKFVPGAPAPILQTLRVEGAWPETSNHVVFLDFWATWCPPCERSYPLLNELHDKYKDRGLIVIGVSQDEDAEEMKKFVQKQGAKFTNVRDAQSKVALAFNAGILPRTVLIGADGKIAASHIGFDPFESPQKHREDIEAALKAAGR